MKALVYRGKNQLKVEEVPIPEIGPGELLVKVACCGVCPTDIKKIQYGTVPPPRIFGHETAGTIVQLGTGVSGFAVGDRVALHHHVPCMNCYFCRHRTFAQCPQYKQTGITSGFEPAGGGFAEYVRVLGFVIPGVVRIPDHVPFEKAIFLEPVNTILKGIRRLALLPGDSVLIIGQGPVGQIFTYLAKKAGMRVLASDLFHSRLEGARLFGAARVFTPEETAAIVAEATQGRGVDAVILTVPSNSLVQEAVKCVRPGGEVLVFAHTRKGDPGLVDFAEICVDEKTLLGSYSADFELQAEVAALVFSAEMPLGRLVSHRFGLEGGADAIEMASTPSEKALKIVVGSEF
jgi:L-iditol 2-dehydrogenase